MKTSPNEIRINTGSHDNRDFKRAEEIIRRLRVKRKADPHELHYIAMMLFSICQSNGIDIGN